MKTKYILHGGFSSQENKQENDAFFKEVLNTAPPETKILLVYFASSIERIEKYKTDDIEQFEKNKAGKKLSFEAANEELFAEQTKTADVIYLHGGRSEKMLTALKKFPDLKKLFEGKIIAADSAGANVLAKAFYSQTIGASEGFGLIPIKIICHYVEENKNKLDHIKPDMETLFLPEYKFKTFLIDS